MLPQDVERRHALRVDLHFPAIVRGIDATGEQFTLNTRLDNLSACGLYLQLQRPLELGATLFVVVQLSPVASEVRAPQIALRGTVMRIDPQSDSSWGVALAFDHHRFLYADA